MTARGAVGKLTPLPALLRSDPGASLASFNCTSPAGELWEDRTQLRERRALLPGRWQLSPGGGEGAQRGQKRRGSGSPGLAARTQVSTRAQLCNSPRSRSRGHLGKQAEPINKATWPPGRGGGVGAGLRAGGSSGNNERLPEARDKYCGRESGAAALREPRAPSDPRQRSAPCQRKHSAPHPETFSPTRRVPAASPFAGPRTPSVSPGRRVPEAARPVATTSLSRT